MKPSLAGACALILLAAPLARAAEPPAASAAPPAPASAPSASTLPDLPTTIDIAPAAPKPWPIIDLVELMASFRA